MSLKMLVVSRVSQEHEVLRQAAGFAAVPIEVAVTPTARGILSALDRAGVDLLFLGSDVADTERLDVLQAARRASTTGKEQPLVIYVEEPADIGWANEADVTRPDGTLNKPFDAEQARAFIDRCARARMPSRVLVVDDSSTVRKVVSKVLQASRFRHEIHEASEGEAALRQVRSGSFDLVFLDCNMPGLDGWGTLAEIKRDYPKIEVVMMTGAADPSLPGRARAQGAVGFLFKPFFPRDINAILHSLYGLSPPAMAA